MQIFVQIMSGFAYIALMCREANRPNALHCILSGTSKHCTSSTYAYVFPSDPTQTIYLCGAYWAASTGDKGATMVHELSHFTVNGGTDDIIYGTANCKNLAKTNPKKASVNADNYCYYAWLH